MNNSFTFWLVLVFVIGSSAISHGDPVAQRLGDILVPPPKDMVEVSDYSDLFRRIAKTHNKKPLFLYYLVTEFKEINEGKLVPASRSAVASINSKLNTEIEAKSRFEKEMSGLKRDLSKMRFSSVEFQKAIEEGTKNVEANLPLMKIVVAGMAVLDFDATIGNRCTVVSAANSSITVRDKKIEVTWIYCRGWQVVENTILSLVYVMPLQDASTPATAKKFLQNWMDGIHTINPR